MKKSEAESRSLIAKAILLLSVNNECSNFGRRTYDYQALEVIS